MDGGYGVRWVPLARVSPFPFRPVDRCVPVYELVQAVPMMDDERQVDRERLELFH